MGEDVVAEADPATCFYVLLSGQIAMSRTIGGDRVETTRTDQRGVYFGAVQFYLNDDTARTYGATVRAISDCVLLALPAKEFAVEFGRWFPMAVHLLEGMILGMRQGNALIGERERLLALGKLSAGLTHELNNPAAAAGRATVALRDRVEGMRHKLAMIASGKMAGVQLKKLVMAQEEFVKKVRHAPPLSPLEASDREDELGDWLDDHGIPAAGSSRRSSWPAGWTSATWRRCTPRRTTRTLEGAIRWLAYTVETESLLREITDATTRISDLVLAAKQYSQMDRAPYRWIDVHEGLDATLVMFGRKLEGEGGVTIVKDYDRTLPTIPAYPAELNQVWTNIIDNAHRRDELLGHADRAHPPRRQLRGRRDRRHRPGHPARGPAADLRAVLHHEGGRARHRARPGRQLPGGGQPPPRRHPGGVRTGLDHVPGAAADDRSRRVKPVSAQPCYNTAEHSRRGSAAGPVRRRPAGCAGPGPRRPG